MLPHYRLHYALPLIHWPKCCRIATMPCMSQELCVHREPVNASNHMKNNTLFVSHALLSAAAVCSFLSHSLLPTATHKQPEVKTIISILSWNSNWWIHYRAFSSCDQCEGIQTERTVDLPEMKVLIDRCYLKQEWHLICVSAKTLDSCTLSPSRAAPRTLWSWNPHAR